MPHTHSAKKNLRKSEKRRLRNRATKRTIRTHLKRFEAALDGPLEVLQSEYNLAAKKLDKAAARRIIHPNLAARKKSQMALALRKKTLAGGASPPATGS
jgi:small subunit ribosomal protein S20